jgi:hypothetical protein
MSTTTPLDTVAAAPSVDTEKRISSLEKSVLMLRVNNEKLIKENDLLKEQLQNALSAPKIVEPVVAPVVEAVKEPAPVETKTERPIYTSRWNKAKESK